jgi:hypothetical protein
LNPVPYLAAKNLSHGSMVGDAMKTDDRDGYKSNSRANQPGIGSKKKAIKKSGNKLKGAA